MTDELIDIQKILLDLYQKNIDFLRKNYPEIYDKVNEFSLKIENSEIKERYNLDYKEDGYFDIFDNDTNNYIYGFNSYDEADKRVEITNFDMDHSLNLLRIDPNNNKLALMECLGNAKELVNYINQKIDFNNIKFQRIFKYIYIGVGLGVHITELDKKINSMTTLIIEPNLEIFRLSLFTTDYSIFTAGTRNLFLSVNESNAQRTATLMKFSNYHSYMNYNIKHHLFWIDYKSILDEIIDFFLQNSPASFSYHSTLAVFARTIKYLKDKHSFFTKKLIKKHQPLKNKKILLIGAGPSIDEQILWIKENQDKFVIVCVDKIAQKLEMNNIVPDIVASIDPSKIIEELFVFKNNDFLKNSSILFLSQQHPDVIEKIKNENFYFSQVMPVSDEIDYFFSFPNVGTFALAFVVFLGATDIYLTGIDASFNQQTGKTFANDTLDLLGNNLESDNNQDKSLVSQEDILDVKGNLKNVVKSNRRLLTFKRDFENFIVNYKTENLKLFNLSDGVYIEGMTPLDLEKFDTSNFNKLDFNSVKEFKNISSQIDNIDFKNDINKLNLLIKKIEKFEKLKLNNKDEFLAEKLDIMISILEEIKKTKSVILGNIFLQFTDLIDIYINFTLNVDNQELNDKKILMNLKKYWCLSLIGLFNDMIESLRIAEK